MAIQLPKYVTNVNVVRAVDVDREQNKECTQRIRYI
jgi:hypothetical protein